MHALFIICLLQLKPYWNECLSLNKCMSSIHPLTLFYWVWAMGLAAEAGPDVSLPSHLLQRLLEEAKASEIPQALSWLDRLETPGQGGIQGHIRTKC